MDDLRLTIDDCGLTIGTNDAANRKPYSVTRKTRMFLAESYLHTLDPFAIRFSQDFGIRWYGLSYAFGFLVAWLLVGWMARKSWSLLPPRRVGDFMFAGMFGVLAGGRLGYALFYDPHLFIGFTSAFPFWDLLAINKGGMASHGGMIGVILACFWWGRRNRVDPFHLFDMGGLTATIGLGVGRIANFVNAELWGKALPASMQANPPWWSVKYPQQIGERLIPVINRGDQTEGEHALSIATAAVDFHITGDAAQMFPQVLAEAQRRLDTVHTQLAPVIGSDGEFFRRIEQLASDANHAMHDQVAAVVKPVLTAYYPSQIFQAVTDGPLLLALLAIMWLKPRQPGTICAWFLIFYGVLRILTEVFRQPDIGVSLTFGLLSRGQTLSAVMVGCGAAILWVASRRNVPRLGGILVR